MVLIFLFMRDEANNFRKTVLGAHARQKKYRSKFVTDIQTDRQTDRQTDKFFDTIYGGYVDFFFQ